MSDTNTFSTLDLTPQLLSKLKGLGITQPTPIQRESIPHLRQGRDLIGIAQTGTGKTLAFSLPMLCNLRNIQQGLVIAPTRELASQIADTFHLLGAKTALLIGGAPMGRQRSQLRARPAVIVATPGRLMDHITQGLSLSTVAIVVLDEGDRMLDMGFAPIIRKIFAAVPRQRQTMLFSATMPSAIADLAQDYLVNPVRVEIDKQGTAPEIVKQELMVVHQEGKFELLDNLLDENKGSVLVFSRTRHGARKLAKSLNRMGHATAELHSDRTLSQRLAALDGFKAGEYRVLVATDIAARGIDVKDISLVVNYDVPVCAEDYVHRIGRTGRAGSEGHAITLATPEQHRDVRDIERLMKRELTLATGSPMQKAVVHVSARAAAGRSGPPRRSFGRPGRPKYRSR